MMKSCRLGLLATVLLAPAAWADPSKGADWPQFRGPQQNGASAEKGVLRSWPESGPKVLWRKPIGSGFSTVTVAGGALPAWKLKVTRKDGFEETWYLDTSTHLELARFDRTLDLPEAKDRWTYYSDFRTVEGW